MCSTPFVCVCKCIVWLHIFFNILSFHFILISYPKYSICFFHSNKLNPMLISSVSRYSLINYLKRVNQLEITIKKAQKRKIKIWKKEKEEAKTNSPIIVSSKKQIKYQILITRKTNKTWQSKQFHFLHFFYLLSLKSTYQLAPFYPLNVLINSMVNYLYQCSSCIPVVYLNFK